MRFAILCRVSSEDQLSGQSLDVQQKTLRQCVQSLGGEIVKEYIGQESATKSDRPILDQLLSDASTGLFDAVMVYDASRLDRDPVRAKIIFATFKKYGIKLYIQHSLYDLNNPESAFIASLMSEVSQFQVAIQTKKAMESKIQLARRGYPLAASPHGRKLLETDKNKPAQYEIIPEYKKQAEEIYDLYVNQGLDFKEISKIIGIPQSQVRLILLVHSSDEWKQTVSYEGRNEVIITKVPPLLTPEQLERAKEVAKNHKKFNAKKYDYLLGGKVYCGLCKMTFHGATKFRKDGSIRSRIYRHSENFRTDACIKNITADLVESAVIKSIHELFNSIDNLKQGIENALSKSHDKANILKKQIKKCNDTLSRLSKEKDRLVSAILKGILEDKDCQKQMTRIKDETLETEDRLKILQNQLEQIDVKVDTDELAEKINHHYQLLIGDNISIQDLDYDKQQTLVDWFFGHSKKTGVYLMWDPNNGVVFNIVGAFNSSYLGVIQKEWNGVLILGYNDAIEQPFVSSNNPDTIVDFKGLLESLGVQSNYGKC